MSGHCALEKAVEAALGAPRPVRLGIAVSGGSDSLALLHILHAIYLRGDGGTLEVATVDHGLRDGSGAEAATVKRMCTALGMAHTTLHWNGWDGTGNLQDAARKARYALLTRWAAERRLSAVALGHTADDQAETVLLRLARGSGVDGLTAMAPRREVGQVTWFRPMLALSRADLRADLDARRVRWFDDPSNENRRFDRIKARDALAHLGALGLDARALGLVARNMADARVALEAVTQDALASMVTALHGSVTFSARTFLDHPVEIQRRIAQRLLDWVAPAPYPVRRSAMAGMLAAIANRRATTLAGCAVRAKGAQIFIFREFDVVADEEVTPDQVWDGRWRCDPAAQVIIPADARIAALGAKGLKQCDNWRDLGLPRGLLMGHPALWHGDTVLSSPAVKPHELQPWTLTRGYNALLKPAL